MYTHSIYKYMYKLCFIYLNYILLLKVHYIFQKELKNYIIYGQFIKDIKKILKTIYSINATIRTEYEFEITTQNQSIHNRVPEVEASVTFDNCN